MTITEERRLDQTRWAWINEYGLAHAGSMLERVAELRTAGVPLVEAIARADPETEADFDGFCASRW